MAACRVALADLADPPDTSVLAACDEATTAFAVERVRLRLLRRRRRLVASCAAAAALDAVVAQLRRLQNPHLCAYRRGDETILSEPFNGVASSVRRAGRDAARAAVGWMMAASPPSELIDVLAAFGEPALRSAAAAGVSIALVPEGRPFASLSPSVARCAPAIDEWPSPPSGLFVVDEKRVLLRTVSMRMTAAHEFAHAIDAVLALKPRSYFSYESEELRYYFATNTGFINEYAASSLDEYFAESMRAYVEINDERCAWLPLTRQDLFLRDPRMFALIERLFRSGFGMRERRAHVRFVPEAGGPAKGAFQQQVSISPAAAQGL